MAKVKKQNVILTPDNIQQENSKYEKTRKINFKSGGYTEIDTFFKPQKAQVMIRDFAEFLAEYEKRKGKVETEEFYLFFTLHLMKHFSSICPIFPSDFAEKIDFFNKLAEHPCVFELKDAFNPKEVAKVFNQMFKQLEDYQTLMKQDAELKQKFMTELDKLENADAIKSVMFGMEDEDVSVENDSVQES